MSGCGSEAGFVEQVSTPAAFPVSYTTTGTSINLSWDVVPGAMGYMVYCGLSPDVMQLLTDDLLGTAYAIRNLVPGQVYFVQVLALLSARRSVAGLFMSSGGGHGSIGVIAATAARDLVWAGFVEDSGYAVGVLSRNLVLATLTIPRRGSEADVYSQLINDTDAIGYIEIEMIAPSYDSFGGYSFAGVVDNPVDKGPFIGFTFSYNRGTGFPSLTFHATTDDVYQIVTTYENVNLPFYSVVGMVIDSPNLRAWVSLNGQFWDSASRSFQANYMDCMPHTLTPGGRTVQCQTRQGAPF